MNTYYCECCSFTFALDIDRTESEIFSDNGYNFNCSLCGNNTSGDSIEFACISDHIHPNDKEIQVNIIIT